jgi:arylesterase / paraoxonase
MRVPGKTIALILVAGVAAVALGLLVYPERAGIPFAGGCRALPVSAAVSDIAIDNARGIAYLAYLNRTGTVMLVDLNAAEPRVRAALASDPPDFRPVALSLYVSPEGTRRLFVADAGASLHIFEQAPTGAFALLKSMRDPLIVNPTAVVGVGPEQFYVTTDAAVIYFDGQRMTSMAGELRVAAGIAASPDGRVIYVSETGGKRLQRFDRDPASGTLTPQEPIALPIRPNHVSVDAAGTIWVAADQRVLTLNRTGGVAASYRADTNELERATAVAARPPQVVLGSLSDPKLLLCQTP